MTLISKNRMFDVSSLFSRARLAVLFSLFFSGCTHINSPTPNELSRLENPPDHVKNKLDLLTPLALQWVNEIEQKYVNTGRSLNKEELQMARSLGVSQPEKVRVIVLKSFPDPGNNFLLLQTKNYGLGASSEGGRTMGNIIMLKAQHKDKRWLMARELAHIVQQEKMGRNAYVRRFIAEYEIVGRQRSPLELEARKIAMEYE